MARAKKNAQGSFEDVMLADPEGEIAGNIEVYLATQEAMANHRRADREIKKAIPKVEKPTRFLVGELYIVEATPFSRDGHSVGATSGQYLQLKDVSEG